MTFKPQIGGGERTQAEQNASGAVDQNPFPGRAVGGKKAMGALIATIGPKALCPQFFMLGMPS